MLPIPITIPFSNTPFFIPAPLPDLFTPLLFLRSLRFLLQKHPVVQGVIQQRLVLEEHHEKLAQIEIVRIFGGIKLSEKRPTSNF